MKGSRLRLAFVSPRWAPAASGGAEVLSRLLAEHLVGRGHYVEAFATCAVTRDHVVQSNGGLWFDDYLTFGECLSWFRDNPAAALGMAESGRAYSWEAVIQRFERAVEQTMGSALDS